MKEFHQGVPRGSIRCACFLPTLSKTVYTYVVVRASAQTAKTEYIVKHRKREERFVNLCTLSTDTASKLDILWHNGDTLGVDGTQVGVLKQSNEVSLTGLLKLKRTLVIVLTK